MYIVVTTTITTAAAGAAAFCSNMPTADKLIHILMKKTKPF